MNLPIHVKTVAAAGASMELQWWWRAPSFEQESGVSWCFSVKVHGWYSPYAGKVLKTSMVCTLHSAWSIPNWTVRPLNCTPWRLWTVSRMKPSSMRVALSLLTFGRCSLFALNQWHAWFFSRYHGDLITIRKKGNNDAF